MDTEELAKLHQRSCPTLALRPMAELLLWYADLDLRLLGEVVRYRCPECGILLNMPVGEFLERDSSIDLRCNDCRGEPEERVGAMW